MKIQKKTRKVIAILLLVVFGFGLINTAAFAETSNPDKIRIGKTEIIGDALKVPGTYSIFGTTDGTVSWNPTGRILDIYNCNLTFTEPLPFLSIEGNFGDIVVNYHGKNSCTYSIPKGAGGPLFESAIAYEGPMLIDVHDWKNEKGNLQVKCGNTPISAVCSDNTLIFHGGTIQLGSNNTDAVKAKNVLFQDQKSLKISSKKGSAVKTTVTGQSSLDSSSNVVFQGTLEDSAIPIIKLEAGKNAVDTGQLEIDNCYLDAESTGDAVLHTLGNPVSVQNAYVTVRNSKNDNRLSPQYAILVENLKDNKASISVTSSNVLAQTMAGSAIGIKALNPIRINASEAEPVKVYTGKDMDNLTEVTGSPFSTAGTLSQADILAKQTLFITCKQEPADYTNVSDAINAIPEDLSIYTEETVAAVTAAKEAVVWDKKADEQELVNGYAEAIKQAVQNLELKPADYSAVQTAIDSIPEDLSIYTGETVAAVTAAKEAVVWNKKADEQELVNGYAGAIAQAVQNLVLKPADYSAVQTAIDSIPEDLSIYTEETVAAVTAAKEAVVWNKKADEQELVNDYAEAIAQAVQNLELKPADYTGVNQAIDSIPEDLSVYTDKTVAAVTAAKEAVDWDKKITEQELVDDYAEAIQQAVQNLELKPADFTKVNRAIDRVKQLDRDRYSNFYVVERAVRAVDWDLKITEQEKADQQARDIYDAIDELKLRNGYPVKPSQPEKPEVPSEVHPSVTVTTPESSVKAVALPAPQGLLKDAAAQISEITLVGGADCAATIKATENGQNKQSFRQPLTVTVKVPDDALLQVSDRSQLSLARVTTDMRGQVSLEYMGGSYQTNSGTFVAKVDKAGTYILVEKQNLTKIVLTVGDRETSLNDRKKVIDVAPMILNSRTMVPLRFVGEALDCRVDWDEATRTVTVTDDGKSFTMTIDQEIPGYGQAPVIVDGRTLVPIRYVSESFGANVIYDPSVQEIIIVK